jgi:hypothetical protein
VAAPLVIYLATHPGAEVRIGEVDAPLRALLAGDWRPVLENGLKILGMFGFAGDPLWRQYVAGQAIFEPVMASLFYLSLLLCLWRLGDSRFAFLLLWLFTAALPSLATIDAPSTIRMIHMLPVLTLLPAILIHTLDKLSTAFTDLSTGMVKLGTSLLAILFFYYVGWTAQSLFKTWPQHEEVRFVWQAALTEAAAYLDASPDKGPVALGGWTPESMDPPTMALALRRDDLALRYFHPSRTLVLPTAAGGQTIRVIRPTSLPLDPLLEAKLSAWGASVQSKDSFTLYSLPSLPAPEPQFPADIVLGHQLRFLGYDLHLASPAASLSIVTYWQVTAPADGPRRLFLHLVDSNGRLMAQDDGLEAPALYWRPGDILLQRHSLSWPSAGFSQAFHLRLGVYDPESCVPGPCHNLLTAEGAAYIRLLLPQ